MDISELNEYKTDIKQKTVNKENINSKWLKKISFFTKIISIAIVETSMKAKTLLITFKFSL